MSDNAWNETDKALWILENGKPEFAWIFERNGDIVYKRPMAAPGSKVPPWVPMEREEVTNKIVGQEANSVWIDELDN